MFNQTENDERKYLDKVKSRLTDSLKEIDNYIAGFAREVKEQKEYLWENKAGMDHVEKISVRQSVTQSALSGEAALEKKRRLIKIMASPWFGRIDFRKKKSQKELPVYIGVHAWYDEKKKENVVYDWRAPVSTMFYDYEPGPAGYESPEGTVEGEVTRKRQYRIKGGVMEYMLESSLTIHDDILQQELGKSSDDRMKQIVATIQRDQNAIIRNEVSPVLIIQGVAGSGKTSIALHRVAFLLYRYRESVRSEDVLIISPNKVFADYISNVLPELGEEKIPETGMEELAAELLDGKFRFQTYYEQVDHLLEKEDSDFGGRIGFKATFEFLNRLNEYVSYIENEYFTPALLTIGRYPVPEQIIEEKYRSLHRLPLFARFNEIVKAIERDLLFYYRYEITAAQRNEMRKAVSNMFRITNLRELYRDFHGWLGRPDMLKSAKGGAYEYADLFPLVYLKTRLEGVKPYDGVKHLLVDEMQDYTPVQYAVLARLFPCRKTILGDANQSVNPYSSSTPETIARVFAGADIVKLTKSYRSTYEIAAFAQQIQPDADQEIIERHGEPPAITECRSWADEVAVVIKRVNDFRASGYNSMGIVCKTQKKAAKLHEALNDEISGLQLLTTSSTTFGSGITVTPVHLAKGLEFDHVLIPGADSKNYHSAADRSLLYIACTRAMHRLEIIYSRELSPLIKKG